VDAGQNRSLLEKLKLKGVPTFLFYNDGKVKDVLAWGKIKIEDVKEKTDKLLS
jgi:hypothetical protein